MSALHIRASVVDSPEAQAIQHMSPTDLAVSALHIRASYYTIVAGFVVYFYDIFLTLDDEATLLWAKGGRFIKGLYLTNRYLPFIGLIMITYANNPIRTEPMSDVTCQTTFILTQICQAVEIVVATSIFVTRIYTIYHGHIAAQRFLVLVLIISHLALLSLMAYSCLTIIRTMFYSITIRFCVGTPNHWTGALYLTPIIIESFIVFMTLIHAFTFGRRQRGMCQTAASSILRTLYLDGAMYYLIICGLRVATALVYYLAPETLILLMPYFEYSLTSAITSRWFLSFRRTLVDTFSTHQETTLNTQIPFKSPVISFGCRGSNKDRLPRGRRQDTFLSSYAPKTSESLAQDPLPVEIGFSSLMNHELKALDSNREDWERDVTI